MCVDLVYYTERFLIDLKLLCVEMISVTNYGWYGVWSH